MEAPIFSKKVERDLAEFEQLTREYAERSETVPKGSLKEREVAALELIAELLGPISALAADEWEKRQPIQLADLVSAPPKEGK